MKKVKRIIISILSYLILLLLSSNIFADEIKISDVLGDSSKNTTTTTEQLDQQETEREANFLNQLLLEIPAQTDNPSYTLTFTDPSPDKKGVQLEIDSKSYIDIRSPYSLPALSIGKHILKFKFADQYNTTQILEKEIIIIPRPPILNTPNILDNKLVITGTGLANSELTLILASDEKILVKETTVDSDGKWSISVEENIPSGIYSFIALLRKYGFSSNPSQPVTANMDKNITSVINQNNTEIDPINFSLKDINFNNLSIIISNNPDLLVVISLGFFLGIVITLIVLSLARASHEKKEIKKMEKIVKENGEKKGQTLFEKLTQDKKENVKEKKEEKVEEKEKVTKQEKKEQVKFMSKIDFLKDFKHFDPDDEQGKEKENIKISLKSKS